MTGLAENATYLEEPPNRGAFEPGSKADRASRFWRTVWRLHFYVGMLVLPVLVTLAVTGTAILYKDAFLDFSEGHLRKVDPAGKTLALDEQIAGVQAAYPDLAIGSVTPPSAADRSTIVQLANGLEVFVNPYEGKVLGTKTKGRDLPALAERVHGNLLMGWKVKVPTLAGLAGPDPLFAEIEVGDLLVELLAGWGILLAISGVYLWWPRKRAANKALLVPRLGKKGRSRWRDLHAIPGVSLSGVLVFLIMTGMPWSGFWGGNWNHLTTSTNTGTNAPDPEPSSTFAQVGDRDRFGNPIPWAAQNLNAPASKLPDQSHHVAVEEYRHADDAGAMGSVPSLLSLDQVAVVATEEGMLAGYSISLPTNGEGKGGLPVYGAYKLGNAWPQSLQKERTIFLDQFSGATLLDYGAEQYGVLGKATSLGVDTHMGTQFGLLNRIVMTLAMLMVLWSALTCVIMWWKRRPAGKIGLPRRPANVGLQRGLVVIGIMLGVVFPLVGVSMLIVLALDAFVIRRIPRLRSAFGMR